MFTAIARPATESDVPCLTVLYGQLDTEMVALKPVWRLTDGLPEPVAEALTSVIGSPSSGVLIGQIDAVPVGVLMWHVSTLLPQAGGEVAAVIDLIFTVPPAREVGVGEAMMALFAHESTDRDIRLFDAIVPPGHRAAKNFFESNGFKARKIIMHRDDR